MKKISLIALMATLFLGFASTAEAINFTIGDSRYLGSIDPSTPANETAEAGFINQLIDLAAPSGPTVIDGKTYIRTAISCGACVDANAATALSDDVAPFNPINLGTGWTYLYGKYGTTAHVWLVTGVTGTGHTLPDTAPGGGLSHWALFNPGTTQVPEPTSLLLLGSAMAAIGAASRWIRK